MVVPRELHAHHARLASSTGMAHQPRYAIIWCPIPLISWIFPAIGHMGLSTSTGGAVDFAGPYMVNEDEDGVTIFGRPTRYLPLNPRLARTWPESLDQAPAALGVSVSGGGGKDAAGQGQEGVAGARTGASELDAAGAGAARWWDDQLAVTISSFRRQSYNILGNNCHALVADFLNEIEYKGSTNWDMVQLTALMLLFGRFTSLAGFLHTWLPFAILVAVCGYFGRLWFLVAWAAIVVPLVGWFLVYNYVLGGPPCSAKRRRSGR